MELRERQTGDERSLMRAPTRRGFIAGLGATAAVQALPGSWWSAAPSQARGPAHCTPNAPGERTTAIAVAPGGRTVWSTDSAARTITAHRTSDLARAHSVDVGGAPIAIAIAPDGRLALVTTAFYDHPGLAVVDLRAGRVVRRLAVGPEPRAAAFAPDGRTAYVVGGGSRGTLTPVVPRSGHVGAPISVGAHPRGLAVTPDGATALVALNTDSAVCLVSLRHRRVSRHIATAPSPYLIAMTPDGRRAYVSHNDYAARHVTPLELAGHRAHRPVAVGHDPAGVVVDASGRLVAVAGSASGDVTILDARTGRRRRVPTGGTPRALAVARGRLLVADARTGAISAHRFAGSHA